MKKVAFITGGNRGIGFHTALGLKEHGVHVVIGARDKKQGESAAAELRAQGVEADSLEFDLNNHAHHAAAHAHFEAQFGKLDILVNNAAIADGPFPGRGPGRWGSEVPMETLRSIFETNFFSVVALTNHLLPLIRNSQAGRIVNLSSIVASLTLHQDPKSPIANSKSLAYDASKTALNAYTVHLAWELRHTKIKVNSAHPGWVKTEMGGPLALLDAEEGAKTSVRLATLDEDGPSGGFFHLDQKLPW